MRTWSFASFLLSAALHAQITIGPLDMPSAGDTMRYRTTLATTVDLFMTGPATVWDMSMLAPDVAGADTAVAVSSTPFAYQFFFNNPFIYPTYVASYAMKGQDLNFQALTLSNLFDFYRKDTTGFQNVGFGANINGLPTSVQRIPVDVIHRFPLNFGDQDSSFSHFAVTVPSLLSFEQDQLRINEVDGWGTLYLPADTFEVLRVRSVLQRSDTIFINQFNTGFRLDEPETVEYKWIAAGMDAPVLRVITVGGQATTARFFYEPDTVNTGLLQRSTTTIALHPNPADDRVQVDLAGVSNGVLDVIDAKGGIVGSHPFNRSRVDLSVRDLPSGTYTLRVRGLALDRGARMVVTH